MHDPDIEPQLLSRVQDSGLFVTTDRAWFMEPLERLDEETPACFIHLAEDGPDGRSRDADPKTICPRQRITLVYGVWIVCEYTDLFRLKRQAMRELLFGWPPTDQHEPMAYRGGVAQIKSGHIWWYERWSVDTWLRNNNLNG